MPYICKEDRLPYKNIINEVVYMVESLNVDVCATGELTAYFCHQVVEIFMGGESRYLDDIFFDPGVRDKLDEQASLAVEQLGRQNDLCVQAGELNYVLSSVIWGVLGDNGKYALRAYIKGCLHHIINGIERYANEWSGINRRYLMILGVLTDVIDETYRRRTAVYEDEKIALNGDIWPLIEEKHLTPEDVASVSLE